MQTQTPDLPGTERQVCRQLAVSIKFNTIRRSSQFIDRAFTSRSNLTLFHASARDVF